MHFKLRCFASWVCWAQGGFVNMPWLRRSDLSTNSWPTNILPFHLHTFLLKQISSRRHCEGLLRLAHVTHLRLREYIKFVFLLWHAILFARSCSAWQFDLCVVSCTRRGSIVRLSGCIRMIAEWSLVQDYSDDSLGGDYVRSLTMSEFLQMYAISHGNDCSENIESIRRIQFWTLSQQVTFFLGVTARDCFTGNFGWLPAGARSRRVTWVHAWMHACTSICLWAWGPHEHTDKINLIPCWSANAHRTILMTMSLFRKCLTNLSNALWESFI